MEQLRSRSGREKRDPRNEFWYLGRQREEEEIFSLIKLVI